MGKKGFKDVNMLFLGGGLLLVVLFFLGAFAVKEGFSVSSGSTITFNQGYLTSDGTTGEATAKSKIDSGLNNTCSKTAANNDSTTYTLGTITYSVYSSKSKKIGLKGRATCSWP